MGSSCRLGSGRLAPDSPRGCLRDFSGDAAFSGSYPAFLASFLPAAEGEGFAPGGAPAGFTPVGRPEPVRRPAEAGQGAESASPAGEPAFAESVAVAEWRLFKAWTARLLRRYSLIHGAVLGRAGRAVIVAGVTGSGKTTLTLRLLRDGWTYLSDDCAVLCPETLRVWPTPGAMHVKAEPASDDLALMEWAVPYPEGFFAAPRAWCAFVRGELLPPRGASWPVAAVFFPDRRGEPGAPLLERLAPGRALADLTFQSFAETPEQLGRDFRVLARLVRSVPVYRLQTADLGAAVRCVGELVAAGFAAAGIPGAGG